MTKTCAYPTCNNIAKSKQKREPRFCSKKCGLKFHNETIRELGKRAYAEDWEKRVEWQPISTAPKNQEILIGAMVNEVDGWRKLVKWNKKENCWKSIENGLNIFIEIWQPTHWLSIPELKEGK